MNDFELFGTCKSVVVTRSKEDFEGHMLYKYIDPECDNIIADKNMNKFPLMNENELSSLYW